MPYELIYRMQAVNTEGNTVIIHVSDTTSGTVNPPTYIDLELVAASLKVVNDDEDKFKIIKGKRIEFSFLSTPDYGLSIFVEGEDNRWLVEVFIDSTAGVPLFIGYLVVDATQEGFLDAGLYTVELAASDNLALLKDIPLTKPDGTNPRGKFKIIEYISWCLRKTNMELPINAVYNLFEEDYSGATDATFDKIYLDAKTFETEINECENCYSVLEKILKGCFLTQEKGQWWIVRVDELNASDYRYYEFTFDGVFTGAVITDPIKTIGIGLTIEEFVGGDGEVFPSRPVKYVKCLYSYEYPQEIICNIDFSRGIVTLPIPVAGGQAYTVECWTNERNYIGPPASVQSAAYIKRLFTNGYETERTLVLPATPIATHYVRSEPIPLNHKDKFRFSVDRRLSSNISGSSGTYRDVVAQVRLYGNDGTFWMLAGETSGNVNPGDWVSTNATFSTNSTTIRYIWNVTQQDEREWQNVNVEARPVPVGGNLVILLIQSGLYGTSNTTEFQNLSFEYIPLINGIYRQLSGQYHRIFTDEVRRAKVEEDVYLSDAPSKLFKGALFKLVGSSYELAERWYNYNAGTSGELGLERFGKYQAFEFWNQYNRIMRRFTGTLLGLDSVNADNMPGLLHRYQFQADSEHTTNKYFMLLGFSQDLLTCQWDMQLAEIYDSVEGKDYSADHEFKYTTQ